MSYNKRQFGSVMKAQHLLCNTALGPDPVFLVRVYDTEGKLKQTISVEELNARSVEEEQYGKPYHL